MKIRLGLEFANIRRRESVHTGGQLSECELGLERFRPEASVMLPCNVAVIAIAAIFYAWRDMYLPKRIQNHVAEDRVARLIWAAASQTDSDCHPPAVLEAHEQEEPEDDWAEKPEPAFTLFRNVECRACGGKHTFHSVGAARPTGSTFEFTCPVIDKAAWIWWLEEAEPVEEAPAGSVKLTWVPG